MTRIRLVERVVEREGYRQIYTPFEDEHEKAVAVEASRLQTLQRGARFRPQTVRVQNFYGLTEAQLVHLLKTRNIGRPSTYALVVQKLLEHGLIQQTLAGRLQATALGQEVFRLLDREYPHLLSETLTAEMEQWLDALAQGKASYVEVVKRVWWRIAQREG